MFRTIVFVLPLLILGCGGLDRSDFIDEYAQAYCGWKEDCGKIGQYGTKGECLDDRETYARYELAPDDKGCSFDEDKAEECVDAFEDLGCGLSEGDTISACQEVSDCFGTTTDDSGSNEPT